MYSMLTCVRHLQVCIAGSRTKSVEWGLTTANSMQSSGSTAASAQCPAQRLADWLERAQ